MNVGQWLHRELRQKLIAKKLGHILPDVDDQNINQGPPLSTEKTQENAHPLCQFKTARAEWHSQEHLKQPLDMRKSENTDMATKMMFRKVGSPSKEAQTQKGVLEGTLSSQRQVEAIG